MSTDPTTTLTLLLFLLISFQIKHFLADFPLQTKYMLRKTAKHGWKCPLLAHAGVHGGFTFLVIWPLASLKVALLCGLADFTVHLCVDFWKARFTNSHPFQKSFWIAFGMDQTMHQLTYIVIAYAVTMLVFI